MHRPHLLQVTGGKGKGQTPWRPRSRTHFLNLSCSWGWRQSFEV